MIKESRVQKYLAQKKEMAKPKLENFDTQSPLPLEDLLQIFNKLKGKNGRTPTEEELKGMILSLMPKVENGKTPTKEELLRLIVPLIPKVEDGKDGKDGKNGRDGKDGIGIKGEKGDNGKNAVLPSLYKLAINTINVIETLEGEDRIDAKAIKNLEKLIKKIVSQETIGLNYGGPGVIFTDKTTIGGSGQPGDPLFVLMGTANLVNNEIVAGTDNTWTLANDPAIGSVHIYANGQRLILGTDYSISGKIITTVLAWTSGTIVADYAIK